MGEPNFMSSLWEHTKTEKLTPAATTLAKRVPANTDKENLIDPLGW